MHSNPILIRNISHLTDARYFAAMGVDWMSMVLSNDPISFSKWHTLRDWISGVHLAAEVPHADETLMAKTIIDAKPEGIIFEKLDQIHLTGGLQVFLLNDHDSDHRENALYAQIIQYPDIQLENILRLNPQHVFLEANWTKEMIMELKSKNYNGGFCFTGESETAVGIRDYARMDEMLELIRS
ncbi:MAG: hypothetical protein ABIQ11_02705 [Saprospiraceae bacterium]